MATVRKPSNNSAKYGEDLNSRKRRRVINDYLAKETARRKNKYKSRLQEIYDFGLSVGLVRDILKARNWGWRVVWSLLAAGAIGMFIFQIYNLVTQYFENPTSTKISYKVNTSLEFPIITICTYARVNASKVKDMQISNGLLTYMLSAYKGMYLGYNEYNIRNKQEELQLEYEQFLSRNETGNFSLTEFFLENGFECPEFLKDCMFQGNDFDCCSGDKILSDVGKCFVVKSSKYRHQTIPGPSGGLKVYINNWENEYPQTLANTNPDIGIQAHILHPSGTALIGVSPLIIFPRTHAMIRLNAVHQKLKKKSGSCTEERTLKYFGTYSFEGCFTECIVEMTLKTCRCVQIGTVPNYTLLERSQLCDPERATTCVQPLQQANNMGFLWNIYDIKKKCNCPIPCEQFTYQTSVSYSNVPNPGYKKARNRIISGEKGSNLTFDSPDTIILDIFFDNLVYTEIKETDMSSYTILLSHVGGQLSIWLGIRLITVFHLIYYGGLMLCYLAPVWHTKALRRVSATKSINKVVHDVTIQDYAEKGMTNGFFASSRNRGKHISSVFQGPVEPEKLGPNYVAYENPVFTDTFYEGTSILT